MKTQLHLGIGESRSLSTFPLAVLAWLEATALKMELASFIKRSRECDRWFVCRGEQIFGPVPFGKIVRLLLGGEGTLPVLHESEAGQEPAPWRAISYRTWPLNEFTAKVWTIGFWMLAVAIGFAVLSLACPVAIRSGVGAAYLVAVGALGGWLGVRSRHNSAPVEHDREDPAEAAPEPE